ncbi:MAG: sigma-E factor negative regulatory protein [Ahniella sp.]|nr:sigma-E factor negative regulatory protein [Ahniella sp.]
MNDSIREQLSALSDGELASDSARFLLKRLDHDPELGETWERYHVIRDCLRRQQSLAPPDFSAQVMAGIEADGLPGLARRKVATGRGRNLMNWLGGGAVAAAVAVVALLSLRPIGAPETLAPQGSLASVETVTTADLAPAWRLSPVSDRQAIVVSALPSQSELDGYFMQHAEGSASSGQMGVLPYVQSGAAKPVIGVECESSQAC